MISRRQILQATAWAAPVCLGAGPGPWLRAVYAQGVATDWVELGARDVARHITQGDIKAEAYYSRLLKQCDEHKALNAMASLDAERVLEAARRIDQARTRGQLLGPAVGVAVAVKDQIAVAGYPAASGNPALKAYRPARNAAVMDALARAGAVAFAKTTCPNMTGNSSLMAQVDSYSPAYGVVRNPYDPTRMAGGSSGGSGVALAARMVPAALGEDTNGSIRVPAAFCGVAGLRPSTYSIDNALDATNRKRYSDGGLVIAATRLDTIGPMARTVADVAFLDELVTGERAPIVSLKGVRIAVPRPDYWEQEWVDPRVANVTRAAFAQLRDAGAHLVEFDYLGLRSTVGGLGELSAMAQAVEELNAPPEPADSVAKWLAAHAARVTIEQFRGTPASTQRRRFGATAGLTVEEEVHLLRESRQRYHEIFRSNSVVAIAAPTVPVLPQQFTPSGPTDFETVEIRGKILDRGSVIITQSVIAPRYGAPGLSVPVGLAEDLPVGLEFDGLPGRDCELLGLGIAVEIAIGALPPPQMT